MNKDLWEAFRQAFLASMGLHASIWDFGFSNEECYEKSLQKLCRVGKFSRNEAEDALKKWIRKNVNREDVKM